MGTTEGQHLAEQYNETAFLLTVEGMMKTATAPPGGLEELVAAHFKALGPTIVTLLETVLEVGDAASSTHPVARLLPLPLSEGFKIVLRRLLARATSLWTPASA